MIVVIIAMIMVMVISLHNNSTFPSVVGVLLGATTLKKFWIIVILIVFFLPTVAIGFYSKPITSDLICARRISNKNNHYSLNRSCPRIHTTCIFAVLVCACVDEQAIEECNKSNILLLELTGGYQGVIPASWPKNFHLRTTTKK